MPGIAGIISFVPIQPQQVDVQNMVGCMVHDPFYRTGTWHNAGLGFAGGWVSMPDSFSAKMPVWNEQKNVCLIFNGEVFPGDEPKRLRENDHTFNTDSADFIVHSYEENGLGFLARLNGWFSGVLVDLRESKVHLFNDRFGLGKICYYEDQLGFYFCSEAKSLLCINPQLRSFDLQSLGEYLSCGAILQDRTLFSGVKLLPRGSVWTFAKSEKPHRAFYFEPEEWERRPAMTPGDYNEQLQDTWARVLPRYYQERDKAALSLTGGVDSRMILAWASRFPRQLTSYTFGGRYRDCQDVVLARRLAGLSGLPHEVISVGSEFLNQFPKLVEQSAYITDGLVDASGSIDLYVQRLARNIAPVRITGTNGGEMLRRIVAFKPTPMRQDLFAAPLRSSIENAALTYAAERSGNKLSFTAFKQAAWYMNSKFGLERSQLTLRMPYFDNELVALSYQVPALLAESVEPALRVIAAGNPALAKLGTDRALALEAVPGLGKLQHFAQELTFKAEYAYDMGMPQWAARVDGHLKALHLEKLFLGRHKFHHFRVYFRDELASYLKEIFLDSRTLGRPFLEPMAVSQMVQEHTSGLGNYTYEIQRLLIVELVHRQLVDQELSGVEKFTRSLAT